MNTLQIIDLIRFHIERVEFPPLSFNNQWFRNPTNMNIPSDVVDLVSLGQNFCISKKNSKQDVTETIKNVESTVSSLNICNKTKDEIREKF